MIIMFLVGVYAYLSRHLRITSNFQLTGPHARVYGLAVIILTIPITLLVTALQRKFVPPAILADPVQRSLINIAIILFFLVGLAWAMRDRPDDLPKPSA